MRQRLLIGLGACALIAAAVIWFLANFELVPVKEHTGPGATARLRPFLAAERFAERMGWQAGEIRSLSELDALSDDSVLLLPGRRQALDRLRMDRILGWVQDGGHLIVEAEYPGVPDPLLDRLGVQRSLGAASGEEALVKLPAGSAGEAGRSLTVDMPDLVRLEVPGQLVLRGVSGGATKLASFRRGEGMVSAAASLRFARNRMIGEKDHAELLWALLQLTPAQALQVHLRPERLSLWGFLLENAAPVLAAGAALLALWLWRIGPRFGPIAPERMPARRRLLDHLRASGRYYWANGLRGRLVEATRDAVLRRMAREHPDFAHASEAERRARLAALASLPPEAASRLLHAAGEPRGQDFIRITHMAQRVHSALEKGEK